MKRCYYCGKLYYRRNLSERWDLRPNGTWRKVTVRAHPQCGAMGTLLARVEQSRYVRRVS